MSGQIYIGTTNPPTTAYFGVQFPSGFGFDSEHIGALHPVASGKRRLSHTAQKFEWPIKIPNITLAQYLTLVSVVHGASPFYVQFPGAATVYTCVCIDKVQGNPLAVGGGNTIYNPSFTILQQ